MEILILDDENVALQNISMAVDWKSLGADRIWTAVSIGEARSIVQEENISIAICDIEVRGENGLQFVQWIGEYYPYIPCIIITSHVNFDYTRTAIKLDVIDYLNKPVDPSALERAVQKAKERILRSEENKVLNRQHQQLEESSKFEQLLMNGSLTEAGIRDILKGTVQFRLHGKSACLLRLSVRIWNSEYDDNDREKVFFIMHNMLRDLLKDHRAAACLNGTESYFFFTADEAPEELSEEIRKRLSGLIDYYDRIFLCKVRLYMDFPASPQDIYRSRARIQAGDLENVLEDKGIFLVQEADSRPRELRFHGEEWKHFMDRYAYRELQDQITETVDKLVLSGQMTRSVLYQLTASFEEALYKYLNEQNVDYHMLTHRPGYREIREDAEKSVSRFLAWVSDWIAQLKSLSSNEDSLSAVQIICNYIDTHLQEDLSRNALADLVYMSPDYMARIFKREKGVNLIDYIIRKKMEYASALLLESSLPVSYIANNVGYSNLSHFSAAFKKCFGTGPAEYRRRQEEQQKDG